MIPLLASERIPLLAENIASQAADRCRWRRSKGLRGPLESTIPCSKIQSSDLNSSIYLVPGNHGIFRKAMYLTGSPDSQILAKHHLPDLSPKCKKRGPSRTKPQWIPRGGEEYGTAGSAGSMPRSSSPGSGAAKPGRTPTTG